MDYIFYLITILSIGNGLLFYLNQELNITKDLANFYGFQPELHLMRNTGVFLVLLGIMNLLATRNERRAKYYATFADIVITLHYCLEAFVYRTMNIGAALFLLAIVGVQIWSVERGYKRHHKI